MGTTRVPEPKLCGGLRVDTTSESSHLSLTGASWSLPSSRKADNQDAGCFRLAAASTCSLRPQIAQSGSYSRASGTKVGMVYILGVLGVGFCPNLAFALLPGDSWILSLLMNGILFATRANRVLFRSVLLRTRK